MVLGSLLQAATLEFALAALTFRICENLTSRGPRRCADHAAEVAALEGGVLVRKNVCLDVAECRMRLVLEAIVECLDDVFLEVITARMCLEHHVSLRIAVLGIGE